MSARRQKKRNVNLISALPYSPIEPSPTRAYLFSTDEVLIDHYFLHELNQNGKMRLKLEKTYLKSQKMALFFFRLYSYSAFLHFYLFSTVINHIEGTVRSERLGIFVPSSTSNIFD